MVFKKMSLKGIQTKTVNPKRDVKLTGKRRNKVGEWIHAVTVRGKRPEGRGGPPTGAREGQNVFFAVILNYSNIT